MPSNILTGSTILKYERKQKAGKGNRSPKGWSLRSLTPTRMAKAIRRKYGSVSRSGRYYHRGNGKVAKHSSLRDRKRSSRKSSKYRGSSRHRGDY